MHCFCFRNTCSRQNVRVHTISSFLDLILRPRLHVENKMPFIAEILDQYEVTTPEFGPGHI